MSKLVAHGATQRLQGHRIYLRTLTENDATEEYSSWLNDPLVNRYLETQHVTIPELRQYIKNKNYSLDAVLFGIFWKRTDKHIGNVKLEPIDTTHKRATLGLLIGDRAYWGKGVGTEATKIAAAYAFDILDMNTVDLGVISSNLAAIRVYKKCGFIQSELQKNAINHKGTVYDRIVMVKHCL